MYGYRGAGVLMEVFLQAALDPQAQGEEDAVSSDLRAGTLSLKVLQCPGGDTLILFSITH